MEAQNHYYGHSGALARYVGLRRPRHIRGLVQHGWTSGSPVETHFRDFPRVGNGRRGRSLFVWSHSSRAWAPGPSTRTTVPIAAPWVYLSQGAAPPNLRTGTVILPFHGIPTQPVHGDHAGVAREWAETEGSATVCLYHLEARDPRVVDAYRDAGHTCVTLGERTDPRFLGRLYQLLAGAERVVSNRLSTPVIYAAALGTSVLVHGDPMRLEGEDPTLLDRGPEVWPEFHDRSSTSGDLRGLALDELGARYLREPEELRHLLGWDRALRHGPWLEHWVGAPTSRAVTNLLRRGVGTKTTGDAAGRGQTATAWFRGALSYLPRPLGLAVDPSTVAPIRLD